MERFTIDNLDITVAHGSDGRVCYLLYPFDISGEWLGQAALKFDVSMVLITGMNWDDDLTPWPAKGEPPGCPDFRGEGAAFLTTLTGRIVPETERRLGLSGTVERTLTGVSLSGLFTLWQWMTDDTFADIICLSGSFWYPGFAPWLTSRPVPPNKGKAYFLLGEKEAKAKVKAFQSVQTDTEEIVEYLRGSGVEVSFELVPGDHYQNAGPRLVRALSHMFPPPSE